MNNKWIGVIALFTLIFTLIWLVLMIANITQYGEINNLQQAIQLHTILEQRYYLMYIDTTVLTLLASTLMAVLFVYTRQILPEWIRIIGFVFVPAYCTLNLVSYLSQITVVPLILSQYQKPETHLIASILLEHALQDLPGSSIGYFNNLAYALLGIPSIIFGLGLWSNNNALRTSGVLLATSGIASILGIIGSLGNIPVLSLGTLIGGGLFLLFLFPMTWAFLRSSANE